MLHCPSARPPSPGPRATEEAHVPDADDPRRSRDARRVAVPDVPEDSGPVRVPRDARPAGAACGAEDPMSTTTPAARPLRAVSIHPD